MIRKTTQAHKAQEEQSGWKIKKKASHTYSHLAHFTFPLPAPTPVLILPTKARGPTDPAKGETLGSKGEKVQYIQLCLIP